MTARITISLGPHFETFISEQVKSGRFDNASEVVRAGLRLLEDSESEKAKLRAAIDEGDADIAARRVHRYATAEDLGADIKSMQRSARVAKKEKASRRAI